MYTIKEKKKSIEELYKAIFSIRESLQDAVSMAQEAANISQQFGGEIPRVITDQINNFFVPVVSKLIDDENTPGAMTPLVTFLDSVPLAMTREEPKPEEIAPASTSDTNISEPPQEDSPEVPAHNSYADQVQESLENPQDEETTAKAVDYTLNAYDNDEEEEDIIKELQSNFGYSEKDSHKVLEKVLFYKKKRTIAENKNMTFVVDKNEKDLDTKRPFTEIIEDSLAEGKIHFKRSTPSKSKVSYLAQFPNIQEASQFKEHVYSLGTKTFREEEPVTQDVSVPPSTNTYLVKKKSKGVSSLGSTGNIKDEVIASFENEEEATGYMEEMQSILTPEEKELFGVEYFVEEAEEFNQKEPEGASLSVKEKKGRN